MTTSLRDSTTVSDLLVSKVPQVTLAFWIIKIFSTTVGETAADFLNTQLGFGLTWTSVVVGVLFVLSLALQFTRRRFVPWVYWLTVVLISIVGTLVTDTFTDTLGVPLIVSTIVFAVLLAVTFGAWWASERTLSIHSITTRRREAFYWLAILFAFALGTAAGDFLAETLALGYLLSAVLFGAVIGAVAVAFFAFRANGVLCFWIAYVLTRPFGASIGDLFSQPTDAGGLGLGTTVTSLVLFAVIVALVVVTTRRLARERAALAADGVATA